MQALQPTEVLSTLEAAGLVLSLTPDNGLKVTPASCLTDTLRAIIRECKPMLVDHLRRTAANDVVPVPATDPDRWCWPSSPAMNTREIDQFLLRQSRFTDRGLSLDDAERLADKLVQRDREGDDRRLCLECAHLQGTGRWRCGNWKQADVATEGLARDLVFILQRCPGYSKISYALLEGVG